MFQGMCYIHGGLGAHGKLRSSNCLIDGRFVLKISDFGLNALCVPTDLIKDDTYYYSNYDIVYYIKHPPRLLPNNLFNCDIRILFNLEIMSTAMFSVRNFFSLHWLPSSSQNR